MLTCAVVAAALDGVTLVTLADEAADGVAALAVGAQRREHHTLVDVCKNTQTKTPHVSQCYQWQSS